MLNPVSEPPIESNAVHYTVCLALRFLQQHTENPSGTDLWYNDAESRGEAAETQTNKDFCIYEIQNQSLEHLVDRILTV